MKRDDDELVRRLTSVDCPATFDAREFSDRVISARRRRQRLRFVAVSSLAVFLILVGVVRQLRTSTEPVEITAEQNLGDGRGFLGAVDEIEIPSPGMPSSRTLDAQLAEFDKRLEQAEELSALLERIERARVTLSEMQGEHDGQTLAMFRADLSDRIVVPDLRRFSKGASETSFHKD